MTMAKGRCESEPMARDRRPAAARTGHQHGHHDGAQPLHGAFDGGVQNGVAARAKLVDVFEHDYARLHGDAEQRQKADAGRDAHVVWVMSSASKPPMGAMATLARINSTHLADLNMVYRIMQITRMVMGSTINSRLEERLALSYSPAQSML